MVWRPGICPQVLISQLIYVSREVWDGSRCLECGQNSVLKVLLLLEFLEMFVHRSDGRPVHGNLFFIITDTLSTAGC